MTTIPLNETTSPLLQVGAVSYLNTKPLIEGLEEDFAGLASLSLDLPSRLARKLSEGELDIALIPSIEFFQNPTYSIVSDACIACRGPVWSVKLLFRVPPNEVQSVAMDEGSRTSVALSKILLQERFGIRPQTLPLPMSADPFSAEADAVLVIGDRAMKPCLKGFLHEWDLGEEWFRLTGLPFVFAMWVGRSGLSDSLLEAGLAAARDRGTANVAQIAKRYCDRYGLTQQECERYLGYHLRFRLGQTELSGLNLFFRKAAELGLAPEHRWINVPCLGTA